jgi:cytoskeletal protein RodZ
MRIGQQLKTAREEQKLTINEVSSAIRINKKYLQALEDENFLLIPSQVYAKGFLKAYAIYLKLDQKELVSEMLAYFRSLEDAKRESLKRQIRTPRGRTIEFNFHIKKEYYTYAVYVLIAVLILFVVFVGAKKVRSMFMHSRASMEFSQPGNVPKEALPGKERVKSPVNKNEGPKNEGNPKELKQIIATGKQVKLVTIRLDILQKANVTIFADYKKVFGGPLEEGDTKTVSGDFIQIKTDNGAGVRITRDGIVHGVLGAVGAPAEQSYKAK